MKLTFKLTIVLMTALTVIFCLYGYIALRHQSAYLEQDSRRDTVQFARTLALSVARVWRTQGSEEAIALVNEANSKMSEYTVRLARLDSPTMFELAPRLPLSDLSALKVGHPVLKRITQPEGTVYALTYVAVPLDSEERLAIEIGESLLPESTFRAAAVWQIGIFLGAAIGTTALLLILFGHLMVGRRINVIRKATERIGAGDFSVGLNMRGGDEISLLASDVNRMSAELKRTRELLQRESDERIKALEQLRHADRLSSLGSLAAGVAHELGTPLSVISGHAANLSRELHNQTVLGKEVEGIVRQSDRMTAIVRQLLDFARARPQEKSPVDLNQCLLRVHELLAPFARRRYLPLHLVAPSDRCVVLGDANQLDQVFTNIVLNAIQATDTGEVSIDVEFLRRVKPGEVSIPGDWACIHIRDKGPGIDGDTLERIFDPFFTTKPVGQGTGMGLSIAHGIVLDHGGWIEVQSVLGDGTEFLVYLPRET